MIPSYIHGRRARFRYFVRRPIILLIDKVLYRWDLGEGVYADRLRGLRWHLDADWTVANVLRGIVGRQPTIKK